MRKENQVSVFSVVASEVRGQSMVPCSLQFQSFQEDVLMCHAYTGSGCDLISHSTADSL